MKTVIRQGLRIRIENPVGSTRSGVDQDGKPWSVTMSHDYGEIVGSKGVDGDPVDVFLGPNKHAKWVYVIHQTNKLGQGFDEDKVFIGFQNAMDAKAAYFKNYDNGNFFYGSMDTIPIEEFKKKVFEPRGTHQMIRASKIDTVMALFAQENTPVKFTKGDSVTVDGMHGRGVVYKVEGRRITIQFRNREYISRDQMYVHPMSEGNYKSKYYSGSL